MSSREKLIERISALLRKAQGTTNEHEAEAFMSKVSEMLEQHNISIHELGDAVDDKIAVEENVFECSSSQNWKGKVYMRLAAYFGCEVCFGKRPAGMTGWRITYSITGRESARETTRLMYPFILSQIKAKGKKLAQEHQCSNEKAYRLVANSLYARLTHLVIKKKSKNQAHGYALVPVDAIKAAEKEHFGEMREAVTRRVSVSAASQKAASEISLYRQTSNSAQTVLLDQA